MQKHGEHYPFFEGPLQQRLDGDTQEIGFKYEKPQLETSVMNLPQIEWKQLYAAAILEHNRRAIPGRVASAQQVLRQRLQELRYQEDRRNERERVESAMRMLDLLLRTELAA